LFEGWRLHVAELTRVVSIPSCSPSLSPMLCVRPLAMGAACNVLRYGAEKLSPDFCRPVASRYCELTGRNVRCGWESGFPRHFRTTIHDHSLPPVKPPARIVDNFGEAPRPRIESSMVSVVKEAASLPQLSAETIMVARAGEFETAESLMARYPIRHQEWNLSAYREFEMPISTFRRSGDAEMGPAFIWIHGGGMISGHRFDGIGPYIERMLEHGGTVVAVEYRLAPEYMAPTSRGLLFRSPLGIRQCRDDRGGS
jgi:hypothetical protein